MLLATIFLFLGCGVGGRNNRKEVVTDRDTTGNNWAFFRRQRSKRSTRGSFVDRDTESQRRVKEEYN